MSNPRYHWSPSADSTDSNLSIGNSSGHEDSHDEEDIQEETWFTVPERMVGYAIGKQGQTKNRIMQATNTYIKTKRDEDDQTFFIIRGTVENRYSAKLSIKETVNVGLLKNRGLGALRFPVVDSSDGEFEVQRVQKNDDIGTKKHLYKLVRRNSFKNKADDGHADYSFLSDQILQTLSNNKEIKRSSNIWCHFGRIHLTHIQPDEESKVYNLKDLSSHLMPRKYSPPDTEDVTKWHLRFSGGIQITDNDTFFSKLEKWMSPRYEKCLPFHRYEFEYLTPSCREIRIKVFIQVKPQALDESQVIFENSPSPLEVKNVLKFSESFPFFYMCESTAKKALVDIIEPSGMDIRLIAEANLTSGAEDDELREEVEILYDYVRDNLVITPDGEVDLPQNNVPDDFDLHYSRMSERKTYLVTSEDGEKFDVILCYESPRDIKKREYNETKNVVDIHLYHHGWESKFKSDTWDPQQVVDKIPQFMACARSLARTLTVDDTIPPEILARGPKALRAYQMALKSGKTKHLRVPVMLVGQSRAGKTSLLRSLKCEKFDPEEDSTEGVQLHRSISKAEENTWREDKAPANSFDDCAARAIAENLTASIDGQKFSTVEDDDESQNKGNEGDSHQDQEVPLLSKNEVDILKSKTLGNEERRYNSLQSGANEPSRERQEGGLEPINMSPQDSSLSQLPEEVSEKASYMLQNPKAMDDGSIHLMTMDFAGQPVYQVTHPVFLSPRGIYILVHSLKNDVHVKANPMVKKGSVREVNDECPMTNMDHLESWLSYVALNATTGTPVDKPLQELNLPRKLPPIFLVCTHADKTFGNRKPENMSLEILAHLKREENPPGNHLVHDIYAVDNTVSGSSEKENEGVIKLRKAIRIVAEHLPQINEDIPIRWLKFEKELKKLVENEQKRYISLKEARNIASKCQVDLNSDECDTILNYLHDLKVIIYFEDTKMIIIDTHWLLDMFVKVITVQPFLKWKPEFEDCWRKLEKKGILDRALVEHLWSSLTDEQNTIDVLLTIMEKFSLLCRWKSFDGSEVFLVPAMLVNSNTKCFNLLSDQTLSPLVIRFAIAHHSLGIFPRLLVAIAEMCNKEWPNSKPPQFFHNFCRFYNVGGENGDFDLVVTSDIRSITVGIIDVKKDSRDPDLLLNVCQWIFVFVRKALDEMRSNFPWMKNMDFEFGIRCPICSKSARPCKTHNDSECIHDSCIHFVPGKELPRCYNDPTSAKTMIKEEAYCCWFPKNTEDDQAGICDKLKKLEVTSSITVPEGNKDIVEISGVEVSLTDVDAQWFARELAAGLKLDRLSTDDPPETTVKSCRELCNLLKTYGRRDIIKELRKTLPSGMTGPLKKEDILVADIIAELEDLTRSLCSDELLKRFAGHLDIPHYHIDSYKTGKGNTAGNILEEVCLKQGLTIGDLYDIVCKCKANSLADKYL